MRKSENDHCAMSELSMGEESLGLKPGLAELKLEPGIHRFGGLKFCKNYQARALRALGLLLADGAPTVGEGKTF